MEQILLFDLDGTLTDPKEGITRCVQYGIEALGYQEPDLDRLTCFIGPPLLDSYMEYCGFTEAQAERAIEKYRERFGAVGMFENEIYGGIRELLKALKRAGKRLGVATSKPWVFAEPILEHFQIREYFEQVVGSELNGDRVKKGDVIREALRRFEIDEDKRSEVLMVGDRKHDILGAKESGLKSVGVSYGYGGRKELYDAGADWIVDTVKELEELLLGGEKPSKPYHSLDREVKRQFGKKLYKLSLNAGMTCPNRDGTLGTGGCIFCSGGGSGDFAEKASLSVSDQLREAKKRVEAKLPKDRPFGYIAYFQAFTNTYGPVSCLERIFTEAIEDPEVEVLSIATRPDCLSEEKIGLLKKLNKKKPVWVELGLQTVNEKTAEWIRRGYPLSCFTEARKALKEAGIPVIAHVILGLLGEGEAEILKTIDYLNEQEIDGIKLQLLHILEGTDLAGIYRSGGIKALTFEEYEALLFSAISRLRPETVIHRITGDGPKKILLAPLWSGNKKKVLNQLHRDMKEQKVYQGKDWKK